MNEGRPPSISICSPLFNLACYSHHARLLARSLASTPLLSTQQPADPFITRNHQPTRRRHFPTPRARSCIQRCPTLRLDHMPHQTHCAHPHPHPHPDPDPHPRALPVRDTARGGVEHLSPRFEHVKRLRQERRKRAGNKARHERDWDRSETEGGG